MSAERLEKIRALWDACSRADSAAMGRDVSPAYVWIDHATGVVARTAEELEEAVADEQPWSDLRFEISNTFHADDRSVVVQAVRSGTLTGLWRSMETTGQKVAFEFIDIFKFDDDDEIILEEAYYDMASVRRQLGYDLGDGSPG